MLLNLYKRNSLCLYVMKQKMICLLRKTMYFQDIILNLQKFWIQQGCILLQPYDIEVGAGTSHPATTLRCLDANPWNVVYVNHLDVQQDGRYAENPNRTQHYYQLQFLTKPSPENIQELCLKALKLIGIDMKNNDLRFVEDNWENPTLGAWGLGYEFWCNGMEGSNLHATVGRNCIKTSTSKVTYGLERHMPYTK